MPTILTAAIGLLLLAATARADTASMLLYRVWESGGEPYLNRVLVTPTHVRMDPGERGLGYTLFDREQDVIYNVSDDDRSVLVIAPTTVPGEVPASLRLSETVSAQPDAGPVDGQQPRSVRLDVNGETCREVLAVESVMPEALEGVRELNTVMARMQAVVLPRVPAAYRSDCDLAELVYAPTRWLAFGLPVEERFGERRQVLLHHETATEVDGGLFAVPADYRRMAMPGLAAP
jgi:hypothetical protein